MFEQVFFALLCQVVFAQDNPELFAPANFTSIRDVTARMHQLISSQTIDAPSWGVVRSAKLATRIYVPLGTSMSLGDFVRVMRTFVEAFKLSEAKGETSDQQEKEDEDINRLRDDLKVAYTSPRKRLLLLTRVCGDIKTSWCIGTSKTTASDDRYVGVRYYSGCSSVLLGPFISRAYPSPDLYCGCRSSSQPFTVSTISRRPGQFGTRGTKSHSTSSYTASFRE